MKREFLDSLGLDKETVDKIMAENGADLEREKSNTTQAKADLADAQAKLAERDYSDAISRAISGKNLKFSSKSAQRAFEAALKEKKLELKDGELTGFDDFIKAQREADPDAFAPDKPTPRIVAATGIGTPPLAPKTAAEQAAQAIGKASAESGKTASNIISMYTGGKT